MTLLRYVAAVANSDDRENEGTEPLEEVGPEGCTPKPEQCEREPGERDAPPEECDFSPDEELVDEFPVEPIAVVRDPKDGLPRPVDQPQVFAPPFTHEHVVCIEDKRTYVELFASELPDRGWLRVQVEKGERWCPPRCHYDTYWVSLMLALRPEWKADGSRQERQSWPADAVVTRYGQPFVRNTKGPTAESRERWIPLRPIRERCRFYARQCFNNDEQPDPKEPGHRINFTHCLKRRSIGGAFMSLKDQAVYACDHRDPPDEPSTRIHLDAFDERRLKEQGHKTLIPMFGLAGEDVKAK